MSAIPKRGRPRGFNAPKDSTTVQSLDRAVRVLKALSEREGMSLSQTAEAADVAPATAYRILLTYQAHGMTSFAEDTQLWAVGAEAFRIGSSFLKRTALLDVGRPAMEALMQDTGETANIAIEDHGMALFVSQVETHQPIRAFFRPGTRTPLHVSGIGKAMMAHYSEEKLARVLSNGLERVSEKSITDPALLREDLARIKAQGYALDDEERTAGMRCVASPVFNAFGEAVAGISISGPSVRVTLDLAAEFGAKTRAAADHITEATGGQVQT